MKRLLLVVLVAGLGAAAWWLYHVKSRPPEVPFARARRETLVSTLTTNGKAEPLEWSAVHCDVPGLVAEVRVREGQGVAKGAVLATLSDPALASDLSAAEAKVAQARADLAVVQAGGRSTELADIESRLAKARFDHDADEREYASLRRLAEKQAATAADVQSARNRVQQDELEIEAQQRRRAALVSKNDHAAAAARLADAEAALEGVRARQAQMVLRAPISGMVYGLAVRPGAYLDAGAPVANVGSIDRLRVRVYVDEPELGRVKTGQPVTITWDALPGKTWTGSVERKAAEIQSLGTRQVGEVLCTIDNPGRDLIPGTNVNAEIRTNVVTNALTIPKEALRREASAPGVYVLKGDELEWRSVVTGASSVTRVQVLEGLSAGDAVALPVEVPLRPGMRVRAATAP